ncbi:hypothetical protein K7I13_04295 [Brucepastera parasyntrophica]|uniref:hypothetical protein n=1 Tax=Brucepastera parasyntrophica TaxID=2880008 RepID=UPI002108EAB8|nr:hypothetical protein [Brucepastera parasyntrophica]ULQ60525.1 hypothetical protein K7I13_04295 [Brucepastera parasyntrophica]
MTIPFLKMQLAGNGFILIDPDNLQKEQNQPDGQDFFPADYYPVIAQRLCNRRYGVGASAVIFLAKDNTIRVFNPQGQLLSEADDALLCAARFAFDSGRVKNHTIVFTTPREEKKLKSSVPMNSRLYAELPFHC